MGGVGAVLVVGRGGSHARGDVGMVTGVVGEQKSLETVTLTNVHKVLSRIHLCSLEDQISTI